MRRPIALVCLAVLLISALAVPAAGVGPATLDFGLWAPCLLLTALLHRAPRDLRAARDEFGAPLPFRGPPTRWSSLDFTFEESLQGVAPCEEDGWPRS